MKVVFVKSCAPQREMLLRQPTFVLSREEFRRKSICERVVG